jgi:hypothetical protein
LCKPLLIGAFLRSRLRLVFIAALRALRPHEPQPGARVHHQPRQDGPPPPYSDEKVANRSLLWVGDELATPADFPQHDCSPSTYDAKVRGLSIVQGPFSVAPCQTLALRFATFSSLCYSGLFDASRTSCVWHRATEWLLSDAQLKRLPPRLDRYASASWRPWARAAEWTRRARWS